MRRDICAVDFSTSSIQVLVLQRSGVVEGMEALLPAEAIADGRILQPIAVQLFVTRLMKKLSVKPSEMRVSVSDSACVTRVLEYPRMPPRDLERSLRFEAGRELPMSPRNAYLGWQVIEAQGPRQTVLLVGAWRDVVEGYLEALGGIGRVTVAEPRSLALARAVGLSDAVLLDWTGDRIQIATVERFRVRYTTSVQLANGAASSLSRLVQVVSGLLPKASGRSRSVGSPLVLLGTLRGRDDVARALGQDPAALRVEPVVDWCPPEPFGKFAATCQAANIGMLLRN